MATRSNGASRETMREVAREFMNGFWNDPDAGPLARAALRQAWDMRKRNPEYEALRARLSDAMRQFVAESKQS